MGDENWGPSLRRTPYFHRFYLEEPTTCSQLISEKKKILSCFRVGSGREVTILKCPESILRNKGLPSKGGCFTRATWELREGKCGQLQLHLAFLSVGRQEKKKKSKK